MTLKRKMSLGLGFLFLIILGLMFFYSYYIGRLSQDAENILKDNYQSLVFSQKMTSALEDMRTAVSSIVFNPTDDEKTSDYSMKFFEAAKIEFENNLKSENSNITEINEKEYVDAVNNGYALYVDICLRTIKEEGGRALYFSEYQPAFERLRHAISNINDVNMQAVERKSQLAKRDSARIINLTAGIGVFCLILAFGYFWYFPFYVSNTISYLSDRMKKLLKKSDLILDIKTDDEALILLQGINLLENQLDAKENPGGVRKDS
jgi:hypothetical protein